MEIQACTHPHPLKTCEKKTGPCSGCERPLIGTVYGCTVTMDRTGSHHTACDDFFLHESCAKLPPEIHQHPFHPQHPLTLHSKPPPSFPFESREVWCDACWKKRLSFTYHCEQCAFNLDTECALLKPTLKFELHEHPFVIAKGLKSRPQLQNDSDKFTCDACEGPGKLGQGVYCCPEDDCDIIAHVYCAVSKISPTMFKEVIKEDDLLDSALAEVEKEITRLHAESEALRAKLEAMNVKLEGVEEERLQHLCLLRGGGILYDPATFFRPFSTSPPSYFVKQNKEEMKRS
ncbi:hypothetical protein F0562_015440 [Nyssa sinensis]|uniref:DC1 domain-containing protein n=1 Tax=Nyssa sinensis TaxID=561372 RepID=A0A5J4ZK74_9ASTE|nr:hypothetical protein F0562_015440 [Nyssa sinensis]